MMFSLTARQILQAKEAIETLSNLAGKGPSTSSSLSAGMQGRVLTVDRTPQSSTNTVRAVSEAREGIV